MRASPGEGYVPALDGLRAIAVLAVVGVHYGAPGAQYGFVGVDLFFVLSGYLITSILAREWRNTGAIGLRRFYIRRGLRLFPALWLMLLFAVFFAPLAHIVSILLYVNNWALVFGALQISPGIGHAWSLAIEEQFYLLWPLAMILLLRRASPRTIVAIAIGLGLASALWRDVLLFGGADMYRVYYGTDSHADGLLLGSALGLAIAYGLVPKLRPRWSALLGVAGAFVLVGLALLPTVPYRTFDEFGPFATVLAGLAVIWSIVSAPSSAVPTLLKFGPLVGLGKISYGLYLWHVPILNYVGGGGPIVTLLLTFVAVLFSYRYVELPIHRLKARIGGSRAMGSSPLRALEPSTPTQIVPRVVTPTAAPEP
jgi:peptidoglycan/LPS O-acetylase OafA/YrhL